MNKNIFRAYDIRGIYPTEINEDVVFKVGEVLAKYFGKGKIVVGHDARLSSPSLYKSLIKSFEFPAFGEARPRRRISNFEFHPTGLITTPMLTFLVNKLEAIGGIMITASHNPREYNGLKVLGKGGVPIGGEEVLKLISNI